MKDVELVVQQAVQFHSVDDVIAHLSANGSVGSACSAVGSPEVHPRGDIRPLVIWMLEEFFSGFDLCL